MKIEQKIFRIKNRTMPWGDYGDILLSGMTSRLGPSDGDQLQLERTGPFIPPLFISGIGHFLCSNEARIKLEAHSEFRDITFKAVRLSHIVELKWDEWDLSAESPAFYPESGSPEDYILAAEHSPKIFAQMKTVWEMRLSRNAETAHGLFVSDSGTYFYVAESALTLLKVISEGWLEFIEVAAE